MQTFKDSVTGRRWDFENDVIVTNAKGVYSFKTAWGQTLNVPTTLQPYTPPAPTQAQELADAQRVQIGKLQGAYKNAISAGFPYTASDGTTYTITTSTTDQINGIACALTAKSVMSEAVAWTASTAYALDAIIASGGRYYICTTAGTSGSSQPTFPTVFVTPVTDGTAVWELFGLLVATTNGKVWFPAQDILGTYKVAVKFMNAQLATLTRLEAEVTAATTVSAVQAITW